MFCDPQNTFGWHATTFSNAPTFAEIYSAACFNEENSLLTAISKGSSKTEAISSSKKEAPKWRKRTLTSEKSFVASSNEFSCHNICLFICLFAFLLFRSDTFQHQIVLHMIVWCHTMQRCEQSSSNFNNTS